MKKRKIDGTHRPKSYKELFIKLNNPKENDEVKKENN